MSQKCFFTSESYTDGNSITYKITIPLSALMALSFLEHEKKKIDEASKKDTSVSEILECLRLIVTKIEREEYDQPNIDKDYLNDITKSLYVDHLVMNLEQKSIAEILDFLASYCGWQRINKHIKQRIGDLDG